VSTRRTTILAAATGLAVALAALAVSAQSGDPLAELRRAFQEPSADARPMMRWWWFGPAVTPASLARDLQAMRDAGIGGVEVQPVYPLVPDADGLANHPYLSPPFLDALRQSAAKARELGLRFDLTLGSGWPYGGPHIPITHAAGRLRVEKVPVKGDRVPLPRMTLGESLMAVTQPDGVAPKAVIQDGAVLFSGNRPEELWVFIASRTGMMVKRAAVGAEGYVLDHYDRAALDAHLAAVGVPQLDALKATPPATIFCDSLEVFGSDWTPDLEAEFQRRRGYDLRAHLADLVSGSDARQLAVRHDWALTLGELYEERFLAPLAEWARARGTTLRIQGYGIPPATLASNRLADLTDGEGAAWKTITAARWASSANHFFDRRVTASETWTWLHSPSFAATPLDLKAEADRHFLQGINQLIGHGWPSRPEGVDGVAAYDWRFYAAGALNDANPWWLVMPSVSRYLQRVSAVLREGQPVADVALYLPTSDARADMKPGSAHLLDLLRERVGTVVPGVILDAGFAFDLIDDGVLGAARVDGSVLAVGPQRYRAIVLPAVRTMPLATMRFLETFTKAGGIVIAVDRAPESVPGFLVEDSAGLEFNGIRARVFAADTAAAPVPLASLTATLQKRLPPDVRLEPASPDIGHAHRRAGTNDVYFVANTANTARQARLTVRARGKAEWWDPLTGTVRPAEIVASGPETMTVQLDLDAYGSALLAIAAGPPPRVTAARVRPASTRRVEVTGPWQLKVPGVDGARTLERVRSWEADEATRFASGVAEYRTTFDVGVLPKTARVTVDFGTGKPLEAAPTDNRVPGMRAWLEAPVREAARVYVNEKEAGDVWCPPWRLDITRVVKPGANELVVRVGNTALNAMAGRPLPDYRLLSLRYGERFQAQTMDQVKPLPSGLLGPVRVDITPAR
jgi:glycosyl hydrolase family 106( putative alpha-L-rhamnosidase)